jgi:predicted Zn-dependent peptidase
MFDYHQKVLDNGLKIVFVPMEITSVLAELMVGTGSKFEQKDNRGIAHFLEHMAFKGTEKRKTPLEIAKKLDKIGASYNASTSREKTIYYIKNTPEHFDFMLDLLADITFNPRFAHQEIDRERGVIIEEFNVYEDSPSDKVSDNFARLVLGDNPLGWRTLGTKKTVSKLNRQDFLDFQKQFYQPENMVLVVAGGIKEKDKVFDLAEKWFGDFAAGQVEEKTIKTENGGQKISVEKRPTEQTHLILGMPIFGWTDDRRWSLAVLNRILGGGMSSRLFQEVREKRGLAYYVGSGTFLVKENGILGAHAGVRNDQAQPAVELIKKEIINFSQTVTEQEVDDAIEGLTGKFLLSLEKPESVAGVIGKSWLLEEEMRTPEQMLEEIKSVKIDDVQDLSREIFKPENLYLAAISPHEKLEI